MSPPRIDPCDGDGDAPVAAGLSARARQALAALLSCVDPGDAQLEQVHAGALTVLLRLVFVVYAEQRGAEPALVTALFEALKADAERDGSADGLPEPRYRAWPALLAACARLRERGNLQFFDPEQSAPFTDRLAPPGISDATIYQVLRALLSPAGQRLCDATGEVEVEAFGAIYEALMGDRRRTGSHYTPRSLTASIIHTTLAPLLAELGPRPTPEQLLSLTICDPAMGSGAFLLEACRCLADRLLEAWAVHGGPPPEASEDPRAHARRLVAARCLIGVDKNPRAVDLAKLSLWLLAAPDDQPFRWLDHALKCGDSLLGLTPAQIADSHWDPAAASPGPPPSRAQAKRRGDALIAALCSSSRAKAREATRRRLLPLLDSHEPRDRAALAAALADQRRVHGAPLHWELEFPQVFAGPNPGFAAVVGNPPFLGGRNISASYGAAYLQALLQLRPGTSGGSDLCAHFVRQAFALLREGGCFGLITTNTIAQGDTRAGGLALLRAEGACIYEVRRRMVWPGAAAVLVSVVHCRRGPVAPKRLDGLVVPDITSFLLPAGPDHAPRKLASNRDKCFQGNIILGVGFTFADGNPKASPLSTMRALIAKDPRNRARISPYLGGREVNSHPAHAHHRYVINFGERSEAEARRWPDLLAILEHKVRPERATKDPKKYPRMVHEWWKFWNYRTELYAHTKGLEQVLVIPLISKHLSLCRIPANAVVSHKLAVFSFAEHGAFAILQSRVHERWARLFSSTLGNGLNYSPTDCFETFPFPPRWQADPALERAGQRYYEHRAALMLSAGEGLTKTYNRFHDPQERDPRIVELRERHAAMDRAVLLAYGWEDLAERVTHEFALEYEESDARRQPWRYGWPPALREELLARLFALNQADGAGEPAVVRARKED